MKYVVVLGDGMADIKLPELDNKSPLEYAHKPFIDHIVKFSELGIVNTIPSGMSPGSDVANLSVLGYNPEIYYSGRSSLEAISMGIALDDNDTTFRCNLITLSNDNIIIDHSADEITTDEAKIIINDLLDLVNTDITKLYPGISYRHCLVWKNENFDINLTPPHDIIGKSINNYLPEGRNQDILINFIKKSRDILKKHPVNIKRQGKSKNPANCIWFWGKGRKAQLPAFNTKYGVNGAIISAVDLLKGIGICTKLNPIDVEGATGTINTNYSGKVSAALKVLDSDNDFVYIHIEAPDECGHRGEIENKVKSIELIDQKIIEPLVKGLENISNDYKLLFLPDHPTPLNIRTHTSTPVPYLIYQNGNLQKNTLSGYNEFEAKKTSIYIDRGHDLMGHFIKKD